ncbi:MAG: SPFH domain-containing protein [Acidobacteriota bacterium]
MPVIVIILAIVFVLVSLSLRVVKEYDRGVIFFLGKYTGVRGPGLIILIPIFEQMTRVTLRTITMNIPRRRSSPRTMSLSTSPPWRTITSSTRQNR